MTNREIAREIIAKLGWDCEDQDETELAEKMISEALDAAERRGRIAALAGLDERFSRIDPDNTCRVFIQSELARLRAEEGK